MNHSERKILIQSYGKGAEQMEAALKIYPREMWHYRPAPGKWSIHENIIHVTDSEVNSYVRCRRFIAEPGSTVMGYDQDVWATKLNYHQQSTEDALQLFKLLRKMSYELIRDLPEEVWEHTVHHSENGIMTMDNWLTIYTEHIPVHTRQMQRIYEAWKSMKV